MTGEPDDFLVYSEKKILSEIAYIHSPAGESQAHLRPYMNTVADWEEIFPSERLGTGQIKVSGIDEEDVAKIALIEQTIQFVLDHRMLFSKITGLNDATRFGFVKFDGDRIENNKTMMDPPSGDPTFADLPKGKSEFYKQCVKYSRPDLWHAYLNFRNSPSDESWGELRQKIIPWKDETLCGVWSTVERLAKDRDGRDYGLGGRFRDGNLPSLMLVRQALL
jgi:hypothetical protein